MKTRTGVRAGKQGDMPTNDKIVSTSPSPVVWDDPTK